MIGISPQSERRIRLYTDYLKRIFKGARDKHEAHRQSVPVLQDMAADTLFLTAALERHLLKPGSLNTCHFPSVGIDIDTNPYFGLVLNCFFPSPTGETDITYNSIHHHGDMLLTTAAAFGPGYEHWLFTPPEVVDAERDLFTTRLLDRSRHPVGNLAFVDTRQAHAVMYPSSLSITVALWSSKHEARMVDHVKRLSVFRGRESQLRDLAVKLGLKRTLDLKVITYFDFYPTPDGLKGMRERVQFERGTNPDYLFSLFHVLQHTGNEATTRLVEAQLGETSLDHPEVVRELLADVRRGDDIPFKYTPGIHFGIPHMNFKAAAIEDVLRR
jgi:hypothetical protein